MSQIFIGNPPENIKPWVVENYKPVYHTITLVKQGDRADNEIAFDEINPAVCTVTHLDPSSYQLASDKPIEIILDYIDKNGSHVYSVLVPHHIVNVTETTVSFMNDENDGEAPDGRYWNHDVELIIHFADGRSASKIVRFVQF